MNGLLPDIFKLVFGCIWLYLVTSGCIVAADGEDRPATVLNGVSITNVTILITASADLNKQPLYVDNLPLD